ncbi:DUF4870 domain-containing protein [Flavobacterium eburneipallidum]|uniref:DUF4870 domain-containing protein n=1 Tax=Flavobacterium eburneipallidum TaxID=3003263 RepID=UPI0022AC08A1|nr:DUF4870 domain-containing protein [Flavobacterium eburneipallidum]
METTNEKNLATFIHLSALSQYFIPFGGFIFPILIWTSKKDQSEFIDYNGKQVINFQLSYFLYTLILALIAIPIFIATVLNTVPFETLIDEYNFRNHHFNIENSSGILIVAIVAIVLLAALKVTEFLLIIHASIKTSNGERYQYPLTIPFLK